MSEKAEFSLGSNFTVHINNRPDLAEGLKELASKYGIANKADLLTRMIQECRKADSQAPSSKPQVPPQKAGFFASIDPMDQELVDQMQVDLWRDKKLKNEGILSYFANLHKNLRDKSMFLVKPPRGVRRSLLETTEPLIDAGEVQSEGQFISIVLRDHFKALKKAATPEPSKVEKTPPKAEAKPKVQAEAQEQPQAPPEEKPQKRKSFWEW